VVGGHATPVSSALQHELRAALTGEVRFDRATCALYSTDASVYQIEPLGVVLPRSRDDVEAAVTIAARHGVPITARGGGTSQAGQSIGAGLVLDTSKYLNAGHGWNPAWCSTTSTPRSNRAACASRPMSRRRAAPPWAA
jgi:FAD/FMN-containing dehydrogenase